MNENADGFASDWLPNTGLAEKSNVGDVGLPKVTGALNAGFEAVFCVGFVSNIPPDCAVLLCPNTNGELEFVFVFVLPKMPVDAVVAGVVFAPNANGLAVVDPNTFDELGFAVVVGDANKLLLAPNVGWFAVFDTFPNTLLVLEPYAGGLVGFPKAFAWF